MKSQCEYEKLLNRKTIDYIDAIRDDLGLDNPLEDVRDTVRNLEEPKALFSEVALRAAGRHVNLEGLLLIALAMNIAQRVKTPKFDGGRLFQAIPQLRRLTLADYNFLPELAEILNGAGVVVVAMPTLEGSRLNGAMRRLDDRYLLLVTDRNHCVDTFWFTVFHEIAHILRSDEAELVCDQAEDEADALSGELLFPDEVGYRAFLAEAGIFSARNIERYAKSAGIDSALVLGRLQKENIVPYQSHLGSRFRRRLYLDGPYPFRGRAVIHGTVESDLKMLIEREI